MVCPTPRRWSADVFGIWSQVYRVLYVFMINGGLQFLKNTPYVYDGWCCQTGEGHVNDGLGVDPVDVEPEFSTERFRLDARLDRRSLLRSLRVEPHCCDQALKSPAI